MSKMFSKVTRTWNPVTGCTHNCSYCWARKLAEKRRLYGDNGFKPTFHPERLKQRFKPGEFIFVCDMGDLFCDGVDVAWTVKVFDHVKKFPKTDFLLLTKNPLMYTMLYQIIPSNCILGCTIETNRDVSRLSLASRPGRRVLDMIAIDPDYHRKMVSIEPIMDFDLEDFIESIDEIEPEFVYVGFDNYNNGLPEPSIDKANQLVSALREFTEVHIKTWKI